MNHMVLLVAAWRRLVAAAIMVAATSVAASAQNVVVVVNGEPITAIDVEQRTKFLQMTTQKSPARPDVIEALIDEKLKVREGKRFGIEFTDAEVDSMFARLGGGRSNAEQLTQNLLKNGINPNTVKARLRADNVWQQLVRGRYQSSFQISEKDLELALEANAEDNVSFDYVMRPILLLVPPGSQAATFDARRKEAEALRTRFKNCEEGIPAARALRDTAVRDQVVRSSGDLPPDLRKILDAVPVGQLTAPEVTKHGVELYAICGKRESKADTPMKRKKREQVVSERFEQQSKAYLARLRREALIERK
jgi:peptidyl-prolyl cis-trans isomerase SurA